jgi:hypothetical protein
MRCVLPLICLAAVLSAAPAAVAAQQPEVRVFVGAKIPSEELRGVRLTATGKGTILRVAPGKDRAMGKVQAVGTFTPNAAQLTAIRTAAKSVYGSAKVTVPKARGEMYAAVTVKIGTKERTALGMHGIAPQTKTLLDALNAALPANRALAVPDGLVAKAAITAPEAKCPAGETATTASREMSLKDAAKAGMLKLTSKGKVSGDGVKVEATWKPVKGPVKLRFNIEFVDSGPSPTAPSPASVAATIEGQLNGKLTYKGQPIKVDVVAKRRSSTDTPTSCFHQIYFYPDNGVRDYVDGLDGLTNPQPQGGQWNYGGANDATTWAHETMHLAGLDDQYKDYFQVGGKEYPVPSTVNSEDREALKAWAASKGLDVNAGTLHSVPHKGHEKDLMGSAEGGFNVPQASLAAIWALSAKTVDIHGDPGDLLLNKNPAHQNLGVGAAFDMSVKPGKPAVKEGMVTYCIDLQDKPPAVGDGFDVLGNAAERPEPGMAELARVLRQIDTLQERLLQEVPGAQLAVWRVTNEDGTETYSERVSAILAAAQVPQNVNFGTPHFETPNPGVLETTSITNGAVDPTVGTDPAVAAEIEAQAVPPKPTLARFAIAPRRVTRATRIIIATVELRGAGDRVRLRLLKRGTRTAVRTSRLRTLQAGATSFAFIVPRLGAGAYALRLSGRFGSRTLRFRVSG